MLPVAATDTEYVSRDTFWNWAAGSNGVVKQVINFAGGLGTCFKSEDTYHHASSYFKEGNVNGEVRYRCICDLCGDLFTAYASDLQESYEAQVAELPAQSFNSDGSLFWSPSFQDMYACYTTPSPWSRYYYSGCPHYELPSNATENTSFVLIADCEKLTAIVRPFSGLSSFNMSSVYFRFVDVYPIEGYYTLLGIPSAQGYYIDSSGNKTEFNKVYSAGNAVFMEASKPFSYNLCISPDGVNSHYDPYSFFSVYAYAPTYKVTPFESVVSQINTTYNIQSRPTSITGDYGIIGDNGQIIKVEGDKIVNETNNTIYNPATGETHTLSDWSYNYTDRSYTVTTETGDTITITYGDENVVIKEGDTTYNIYYLVNGSGSENPGPDVPDICDHAWTETSRTDPTCSTAGKVSSVCSKCGQVKTEPLPATGHTWVVDRTVQTTYDEEGNLLQQGYTIYSCSVCGEQYKDMEGTGPPGAEEEKSIWEKIGDLLGSGFSGIIEIIEAILGKILDALTSLVDMLMDKLKHIVESVLSIFDELPALFGGFLDFLAAIFPFLPPEITTILTFGVIAITFIGILKAVRR